MNQISSLQLSLLFKYFLIANFRTFILRNYNIKFQNQSQRFNYFLLSFVVGDGDSNSPCSSNNVQDGSNSSQDGNSQTTSTTHIVNGCKQTHNCYQNKQSRREEKPKQNEPTTREQEAKQDMQTTREQEAKQEKQPAMDSPDTQNGADSRKITSACEYGVPFADKSAEYQEQASNGIIFEEFVGGSQHGLLNYGIPMDRSVEESKEAVVVMDDSGGSSIVGRVVAFIVSAYSGSCGWLRLREN